MMHTAQLGTDLLLGLLLGLVLCPRFTAPRVSPPPKVVCPGPCDCVVVVDP